MMRRMAKGLNVFQMLGVIFAPSYESHLSDDQIVEISYIMRHIRYFTKHRDIYIYICVCVCVYIYTVKSLI